MHNLTSCYLPNLRVAKPYPNRRLLKSLRLPPLLQHPCLRRKMTSSRLISTHRLWMPHLRQQHLHPERTPSKISSHFSVRRLHHHLGPTLKPKSLNLNLNLFHRSAMRPLVPHLPRIGMSVIIGVIPFHPCKSMFGALPHLLNSHLCLVLEATYGENPLEVWRVQLLAPLGHQRRLGTRKQTKRMCLETSGVVSNRCH
jgi:hypothetical protein